MIGLELVGIINICVRILICVPYLGNHLEERHDSTEKFTLEKNHFIKPYSKFVFINGHIKKNLSC